MRRVQQFNITYYFHGFFMRSEYREMPQVVALVEDDDGRIKFLEPNSFRFIDKPDSAGLPPPIPETHADD